MKTANPPVSATHPFTAADVKQRRRVEWRPSMCPPERGTITGLNEYFVIVHFDGDAHPAATSAEQLCYSDEAEPATVTKERTA